MLDLDTDFMDFGDVRLFLPKQDNLYNLYDKKMRGFSPQDYYAGLTRDGYRFPLSQAELRASKDPRYILYAYIQMLAESNMAIDFLDVGAFAGMVGIRCANLARCFGYDVIVKMFDPSIGGQVIPYNIEINQLRAPRTEFIDQAVSLVSGPLLFTMTVGHLDSARAAGGAAASTSFVAAAKPSRAKTLARMARKLPYMLFNPRALRHAINRRVAKSQPLETRSYLVRATTFQDYFAANPASRVRHQVIKIDTEGLEPLLVRQLLGIDLPEGFSAIIETTPSAYKEMGIDLEEFLTNLVKKFGLFEMYHFPHPTRVRAVEAGDIASFVSEIAAYPHGHTDLLIVPRSLHNYGAIAKHLAQFQTLASTNYLVLD